MALERTNTSVIQMCYLRARESTAEMQGALTVIGTSVSLCRLLAAKKAFDEVGHGVNCATLRREWVLFVVLQMARVVGEGSRPRQA